MLDNNSGTFRILMEATLRRWNSAQHPEKMTTVVRAMKASHSLELVSYTTPFNILAIFTMRVSWIREDVERSMCAGCALKCCA